jgi:hypothetical protein
MAAARGSLRNRISIGMLLVFKRSRVDGMDAVMATSAKAVILADMI